MRRCIHTRTPASGSVRWFVLIAGITKISKPYTLPEPSVCPSMSICSHTEKDLSRQFTRVSFRRVESSRRVSSPAEHGRMYMTGLGAGQNNPPRRTNCDPAPYYGFSIKWCPAWGVDSFGDFSELVRFCFELQRDEEGS